MKRKDERDFSRARRGAVVPVPAGKTRITIRIDTDVLDWFRAQVHKVGGGNYQTLMNDALRRHVEHKEDHFEDTLPDFGGFGLDRYTITRDGRLIRHPAAVDELS